MVCDIGCPCCWRDQGILVRWCRNASNLDDLVSSIGKTDPALLGVIAGEDGHDRLIY